MLTNAMRHARASTVSVRLTARDGQLSLTIRDDGCGIQPEQWKGGRSLGLRGLHERVKLLGGMIAIAGTPGVGTEVSLVLPMEGETLPAARVRTWKF